MTGGSTLAMWSRLDICVGSEEELVASMWYIGGADVVLQHLLAEGPLAS